MSLSSEKNEVNVSSLCKLSLPIATGTDRLLDPFFLCLSTLVFPSFVVTIIFFF